MTTRRPFGVILSLLVLAFGCGDAETPAADANQAAEAPSAPPAATRPTAAGVPDGFALATELGVKNPRLARPNLLTAGQLTEEQMVALAEAGYANLISLRPATEAGAGWEEARAEELGIAFTRLPVAGAADLSDANVESLAAALSASAAGQPTVLYCGSGNRAGAMLALVAHRHEGVDAEAALELGKAAGVTKLEPKLRELLGLDAN